MGQLADAEPGMNVRLPEDFAQFHERQQAFRLVTSRERFQFFEDGGCD